MFLRKQRFGVVSHTDLIPKLIPLVRSFNSFSYSPSTSVVDGTSVYYEFDFNQLFISCNKSIHLAKHLHALLLVSGEAKNIYFSTKLVNLYSYLGDISYSSITFEQIRTKNVFAWNSMISGFVHNGCSREAINCYYRLLVTSASRVRPDFYTFPVVLKACGDLVDGKKVHCWVLKLGLASAVSQCGDDHKSRAVHGFVMRRSWMCKDSFIENAVMDMYAKLGYIDLACKVFERMAFKDVISWNTLITGYAQNGLASEAVEVFREMEWCKGIVPDQGTLVSILPAFSHLGSLQDGMRVHGYSIKIGLCMDIFVGTCLMDLYVKCGRLDDAMLLFKQVPRRSSVPWNAIISGHGIHGDGEVALKIFGEMQDDGVKPDHVTFVSVLSACSHAGLVEQGQSCFQLMQQKYGIEPSLKHYGCMVDLLGRAGHVDIAYDFIKNMPIRPDASVWGALLGACKIHHNEELGKVASEQLFEVDPENVGYYVLVSNMYASSGKWDGADKVRSLARDRGLRKTPGWSSIEVNKKVDVFYSGNQSHPQCEEIYKELGGLLSKMKSLGYVPDYSFVLQDVEDDEKEHILTSHSERLAIAYGIINTPPKTPIRIFKNLRVCGDCHNATKLISKITERDIIVRDSNRFHHFRNGKCSCGDYW
ncbi:hypothetical protein MKX03_006855 [Papaver bracteatum]|nr:hypothetical protein MKX03_006855 [Papaver bracteatum]